MIILGIETSCDETAASVIKDGREILSHVVATSSEMHTKSGGVIPENAAREQVKSIIPVIEEALRVGCGYLVDNRHDKSGQRQVPPIDAIAITVGPGLIGSLLVGVETAKTLSYVWTTPIIPVNHLVAHIYANWLNPTTDTAVDSSQRTVDFPAIALVVSGGHTDLVLMRGNGDLEYIGGTRDDAAGEAFDKTARLLGLPYPGGPSISIAAVKWKMENGKSKIALPRPMINDNNFDFSFSGLKTAVVRERNANPDLPVEEFAYEVQEAITDVLVAKTLKAVEKYKVSTLLLAGGVSANSRLREKFEFKISNRLHRDAGKFKIDFRVPPVNLCTDNASYIAACAEFNYHPIPWQEITANPSLTIMDYTI